MSTNTTFNDFLEVTQSIAANNEVFLPTFADPETRDLKVLEGVPADADVAAIVRDWASSLGANRYFIAFAEHETIRIEEYNQGSLLRHQQLANN